MDGCSGNVADDVDVDVAGAEGLFNIDVVDDGETLSRQIRAAIQLSLKLGAQLKGLSRVL